MAWVVKDWRTDKLVVRHAIDFAKKEEKVDFYFAEHSGRDYFRQIIDDVEYNTRIVIEFVADN